MVCSGNSREGKKDRKTFYGKDQQDLLRKMKSISLNILENGYEKSVDVNLLFHVFCIEWLLNYKKLSVVSSTKALEELNKAENFHLKPTLLTMMYAGLRVGELIALKWKHIDFDNSIISVTSSLNQVVEFDDDGNIIGRRSEISDTKTACSVRQIPVSQFLKNILIRWQKYQLSQEEVLNMKLTDKNVVVFPTKTGIRRTYNRVCMNIRRFNKRCSFNGYHAHRHTFATMLFEQKVNPKIVQKLMGHRDIKTTLKIFNSIRQEAAIDSVNLIAPILAQTVSL